MATKRNVIQKMSDRGVKRQPRVRASEDEKEKFEVIRVCNSEDE